MLVVQTFSRHGVTASTSVQATREDLSVWAWECMCTGMPVLCSKSIAHQAGAEFERWRDVPCPPTEVVSVLLAAPFFKAKASRMHFLTRTWEKANCAGAPMGKARYYSASEAVVRSLVISRTGVLPFMWQRLLKAWELVLGGKNRKWVDGVYLKFKLREKRQEIRINMWYFILILMHFYSWIFRQIVPRVRLFSEQVLWILQLYWVELNQITLNQIDSVRAHLCPRKD